MAELRAARDAPRHSSDGSGTVRLLEPSPARVVAGGRARFVLEYEAGPEGIAPDGELQLIPSPFWGWSTPQVSVPPAAGYTTVEGPEGKTVNASDGPWLTVRVDGGLDPGERLRIVYGADAGTAFVDRYAEQGARLWIAVDGDGDGQRGLVESSPRVDVVAGPAARLVVHVPGTARLGDEVTARVAVLDRLGNVGVEVEGAVALQWSEDAEPVSCELDERGLGLSTSACDVLGVVRVRAELVLADGRTLDARSNPMLVERVGPSILWADLHGHSQLSDGTGTVADYLAYARDVAALDVIAITDHDHWGMRPLDSEPELVRSIRDDVASFHAPGSFVALFGYEWTNWIHGHRHVLEFGAELPILSSLDDATDDPAELWSALWDLDALTFAHHSAGDPIPTDWSFEPPRQVEPVTEVASIHGASESPDAPFVLRRPLAGNFVRDALDRGYALGFVGSGDSHDGHPGLPHLAASNGGGLAGIVGAEHTKASVLDALRGRRTFATNGPRILVRAALGQSPMGSDVAPGGGPRSLYIRAIGTGALERIEVVRSGSIIAGIPFEDDVEEFEGTLELSELAFGEYVYLRVIQRDRGAAWTSPFFIR